MPDRHMVVSELYLFVTNKIQERYHTFEIDEFAKFNLRFEEAWANATTGNVRGSSGANGALQHMNFER